MISLISPLVDMEYALDYINSFRRYTSECEVIAIDNSLDGLPEPLPADIIIRGNPKWSFSKSCNEGIARSTGNYIIIGNQDTVYSDGYEQSMMKCFVADSTVGIVGPTTSYAGNEQKDNTAVRYRFKWGQDEINNFAKYLKSKHRSGGICDLPVLMGFCMLISKRVIDKIGGFDDYNFNKFGGEDLDYCWRARQVGFKTVWCKTAYVHHYGSTSIFKVMGQDDYIQHCKDMNKLFYKVAEQKKQAEDYYVDI